MIKILFKINIFVRKKKIKLSPNVKKIIILILLLEFGDTNST